MEREREPTQWRFYESRLIQFLNICGHTQCRKSIKNPERVASFQKLVGIAFVECSGDEQHNVVDHVGIPRAYKPISAHC